MATFRFIDAAESPGCHPLTSTRRLADFPLGLVSLRQHQVAALIAAGGVAGGELSDWDVCGDAWLDPAEFAAFGADAGSAKLVAADGSLLVVKNASRGAEHVATKSFRIAYSWDLLRAHEQALAARVDFRREVEVHASLYVDGRLQVGRGTRILPGVVIEGDVVIGEDCKIGPNCYLRGATTVGHRCHVGQAVELKNSLLLDRTNVGHLSYIGDSILGEGVNLGAGTITSNLRHDGKAHRSQVGPILVGTGRRKFGAILGDGVHTGIHTSLYPGRKLWPGVTTRPGAIVERDLQS